LARVACTVMQKNEGTLLRPFLRYHAALFGAENIYVVDNGSTDLAVIGELAAAEREGVCIDRTHGTIEDYLATFRRKIPGDFGLTAPLCRPESCGGVQNQPRHERIEKA
jgi:hypothetical protein